MRKDNFNKLLPPVYPRSTNFFRHTYALAEQRFRQFNNNNRVAISKSLITLWKGIGFAEDAEKKLTKNISQRSASSSAINPCSLGFTILQDSGSLPEKRFASQKTWISLGIPVLVRSSIGARGWSYCYAGPRSVANRDLAQMRIAAYSRGEPRRDDDDDDEDDDDGLLRGPAYTTIISISSLIADDSQSSK